MTKSERLQKRIAELLELQANELMLKNPSIRYLEDLGISIGQCQAQLGFVTRNPNGVEFVNGV